MTERVEEEEQAARDQQTLRSVGHGWIGFLLLLLSSLPLLSSLREQELSNLLQQKDYVHAVGLAITLDQPFRVLSILSGRTPLKALLHVLESLLWCLHLPPDLLDEGGEEGRFGETILALREDQTCEPSTPGPGVVHIH